MEPIEVIYCEPLYQRVRSTGKIWVSDVFFITHYYPGLIYPIVLN